jgi:hypothetical protein
MFLITVAMLPCMILPLHSLREIPPPNLKESADHRGLKGEGGVRLVGRPPDLSKSQASQNRTDSRIPIIEINYLM